MNKRLSSVKHYKNSVEQLIKILEHKISVFKKKSKDGEDGIINQSDLKAKLQSKKNAFDRAKETILAIQSIEDRYDTKIDIEWLKSNVERLCAAGEIAISEMLDNMDEDIDISDLGGSDINAAIDLRGRSVSDINEIFDGIDYLREQLKSADGEQRVINKKKEFKRGYVERRTIN